MPRHSPNASTLRLQNSNGWIICSWPMSFPYRCNQVTISVSKVRLVTATRSRPPRLAA